MSHCVYTAQGDALLVGTRLAEGGEGTVFAVAEQPELVLKLFHPNRRDDGRRAKLAAMLCHPPADPMLALGHRAIAWPRDVVFADAQRCRFLGFTMPRIPDASVSAWKLMQPEERRQVCPTFGFRHLVTAGRNLAAAVAALHAAGHRVGDLNESNVLIDPDALVTLIDTDSFQVGTPAGQIFPCTVAKPEYTAPELVNVELATTPRTPASDGFALAVLLFQLLMQGFHPFAGVPLRPGEPPPLAERIRSGLYVYGGGREFAPPPRAPRPVLLPRPVRAAFATAFAAGDPARRPTASEWVDRLDQLLDGLAVCRRHPLLHAYPGHLPACPWCEPAGADFFPATAGLQIRVSRAGPDSDREERWQPEAAPAEAAELVFAAPAVSFPELRPHTGRHRQSLRYANPGRGALRARLRLEPPGGPVSLSPLRLDRNQGEVTVTVDTDRLEWDASYQARLVAEYNGRGPGAMVAVPVRVRTVPDAVLLRWLQRQAGWAGRLVLAAAAAVGLFALARRQEPVRWLFQLLPLPAGARPVAALAGSPLPAELLRPDFWWQLASTACMLYWTGRALDWLWRGLTGWAAAPWLAALVSLGLLATDRSLLAALFAGSPGGVAAPAALTLTVTVPLLVQDLSAHLTLTRLRRWVTRGGWQRRAGALLLLWTPGLLAVGGLALLVVLGVAPLRAS